MTLAKIVLGAGAAFALLAAGFDADAKGGKGGGGRGGHAGGHHSHHSHSAVSGGSSHHGGHGYRYTSVVVGAGFVFWPSAYYWPDYYPAAVPAVEYWYYCQPYAAYYPYVQECPTEWQPVLPTAPSPES
jgi:hypothetical protein